MSFVRKQTVLVVICLFTAHIAHAQSVIGSGHTLSTYAIGLPGNYSPAQIAADATTGTLYFTAEQETPAPLWKIDPVTKAVSLVTADFTGGGADNYSNYYTETDLKYSNGSVYSVISNGYGQLVQVNTATGTTTVLENNIPGFSVQSGLVVSGNIIYFTSGVAGNSLDAYNLVTQTLTSVASGLPGYPSSLAYDSALDRFYYASPYSGVYWQYDMVTGTTKQIATDSSATNFALDPTGQYLYARTGTGVDQINVATGSVSTFVTGLPDYMNLGNGSGDASDVAFAKSSSGLGQSLYIGGENAIYEVDGFPSTAPEPSSLAAFAFTGLGTLGLILKARKRKTVA